MGPSFRLNILHCCEPMDIRYHLTHMVHGSNPIIKFYQIKDHKTHRLRHIESIFITNQQLIHDILI